MAGMHGPGRHGNMGPRPKLENPGKIFTRLMKLVLANSGIHYVVVLVCIIVSALTSVKGMLFLQTLIDDYIIPLMGQEQPDFGPLALAIGRLACLFGVGIVASYAQSRIMVNVSQGSLREIRKDLFTRMEKLPIKK